MVIDDVDGLYSSREGTRILKSLCQTEPVKTLSWNSDTPALRREAIPREFTTISHVALIANVWKTLDGNVSAVEDRGICLLFEPSAMEVHMRTGSWFWDQDIFDFVGERLHLIPEISMRFYRTLSELKKARIDWRAFAVQRSMSGSARRANEKVPRLVLKNSPPQEPREALLDATLASHLQERGRRWENN